MTHQLENSDTVLSRHHPADKCAGENCCIHNLSDHALRTYAQRYNGAYMERVSPEGDTYADPDDPFAPERPNAVYCLVCKETLYSRTVHDFVSCAGGHVFVDGGSSYARRGWDEVSNYVEIANWPV